MLYNQDSSLKIEKKLVDIGESMSKQIKERVKIGEEPNGKAIYKWITGYSRQEILKKAAMILLPYNIGENDEKRATPHSPFFNKYLDEWFELYKKPKIRLTTLTSYQNVIALHIKPFFEEYRVEEITVNLIQKFYNAHSNMAKSTVRIMSVVIHQVLDLAVEDQYINWNPADSKRLVISGHKKIRAALHDDEIKDIISNIGCLEVQERLLLAILIFTGMRRGEALGLCWNDINWQKGLIHIERAVTFHNNQPKTGEPKSKAGTRFVPLDDVLKEVLIPHQKPSGFIIGDGEKPITERTFSRMWQRIGKKIDLYGATPHIFRHTYITLAASSGIDVKTLQEISGHSDIRMTMETYADMREAKVVEARGQIRSVFATM